MNADFLAYAEFPAFLDGLQPDSPFGREAKAAFGIRTRAAELEAAWDDTEALIAFFAATAEDTVRRDRIRHHLKRLPRFPEGERATYDEVECFQIKKFLHNHRALADLLGEPLRTRFSLGFELAPLLEALDRGRQSAESFYISDAYAPELAELRARLRDLEAEAQTLDRARREGIQDRWALDFQGRDFLVVARSLLPDPEAASELMQLEPYDSLHWMARPRPCGPRMALDSERTALLEREAIQEAKVLEGLSRLIREALPTLLAARDALARFDLAHARARLALELRLTRPELGTEVRIKQGRFPACEQLCAALGTPYQPLDLELDARPTVLFGSNMGGKTVALKSLAFLQLCTQAGLFVPAERFRTRVFEELHYIGEGCSREEAQGLSGFGFEIRQLLRALSEEERPSLLLFDEFARTTNSTEAEALISALAEALSSRPECQALFSTHFRGVRRLPGLRFLRMRGLSNAGLDLHEGDGRSLASRIGIINRHMDFRLVEDDGGARGSDALDIAALLGLDEGLIARARHFFHESP